MLRKPKKVRVRFLKENLEGTYGQGTRFTHMGDDNRLDGDQTPASEQATEHSNQDILPSPRARVGDIEEYNQIYAVLMGRPQMATNSSLKDLMKEVGAGDPGSCAQAVSDYLNDRAKIK